MTFKRNPDDDELVREASEQIGNGDVFALMHKIDEIREQRATVTPQTLKKKIEFQDVQIAILTKKVRENSSVSNGALREMLIYEHEQRKTLEKRLATETIKLAKTESTLDEARKAIGSQTVEIENLKVREQAIRESLNSQVSELEKKFDDLNRKIFSSELPPMNFISTPKSQGGYVFDFAGYGTLGPISPVSVFVKRISSDWIFSVYRDEENAATLATLNWDQLSVDQKLNYIVSKLGWFDEPTVNNLQQTMFAPDSKDIQKFNKDVSK